MKKSLLQMIGLRSDCCNAKVVAWSTNKFYCENCEQWLYRSKSNGVSHFEPQFTAVKVTKSKKHAPKLAASKARKIA